MVVLFISTGCFNNHAYIYRDDGLAALKQTPRQLEITKKTVCKIFEEVGLKVTIEANKKVVDFLDVTFDLTLGVFRPYSKPNDIHLYVHKQSNHPPSILKNIAEAVNKRLSENSSNEEIFEKAAPAYQEALNKSEYKHDLKYNQHKSNQPEDNNINKDKKKRSRKQNIIWFNPPYSINVKTKVGQKFL